MRSSFMVGQWQESLDYLEKSEALQENRNRLLWHLEKAVILDQMGELDRAVELLMEADRIVDDLFTESISETAASFVWNDTTQSYQGEDYEQALIHILLTNIFIEKGELDKALIQARRINTKLKEIVAKRDEGDSKYHEDALARFLAGVIYEARGQIDDAIIDYRKALRIYQDPGYASFIDDGVPEQLVQGLYRLAQKRDRPEIRQKLENAYPEYLSALPSRLGKKFGTLVVIHESGHIAIKKAHEFALPIDGQIIRFSFPYINPNTYFTRGARVLIPELPSPPSGANVANFNQIAHTCLEDRRGRIILKTGARLLIKHQITDQAYKNFGPLGGIAANIVAAATETADTRGWTTIPAAIYISRVEIPSGTYQVEMRKGGGVSGLVPATIEPGKLTILRDKFR